MTDQKSETIFARLRPTERIRGVVVKLPKRYMVDGTRFDVERGWYPVTRAMAEKLAGLTHDDTPRGVPIFDVATESEVTLREERERAAREVYRTPSSMRTARGGAVTVDDVKPSDRKPIDVRKPVAPTAPAAPPAAPPMIDGADGDEDADLDGFGSDMGKLTEDDPNAGMTLDDGDDLLEEGGRTPEAPKPAAPVSPTASTEPAPSAKPAPRSRGRRG